MQFRVIRYVNQTVFRRRYVQIFSAVTPIDQRIVQLGNLATASSRWVSARRQITAPIFVPCKQHFPQFLNSGGGFFERNEPEVSKICVWIFTLA